MYIKTLNNKKLICFLIFNCCIRYSSPFLRYAYTGFVPQFIAFIQYKYVYYKLSNHNITE